jgi:adenine-specific DNA-methyltransferase
MGNIMNNDEYTIENRRYIGSKAKLSDWILDLIKEKCKGEVFLDIFAGTGVVSAKASRYFKKLIINDFIESNFIIYKAFFGMEEWDKEKLKKIFEKYDNLDPNKIEGNYFSINFGDKYFSNNNAKVIGYIREDMEKIKEELNKKEYAILLASLIYSVDKIANTVGHYDAYRKVKPKDYDFKIKLIKPIKTDAIIYKEDSNKLAKKVSADVVYIDPPYNSRQYSRFIMFLRL